MQTTKASVRFQPHLRPEEVCEAGGRGGGQARALRSQQPAGVGHAHDVNERVVDAGELPACEDVEACCVLLSSGRVLDAGPVAEAGVG